MLLLLLLVSPVLSTYAPDLVANLPGANFTINFKHYSGYVQPSSTKMFHYWLTESMQNPSTDPLLLWLNGGPGCSSVGGLIEENGPFHVSDFGNTVYLNKYAWNTFANVLFLESPAGVGYSFSTDGAIATGDDQTAIDNYNALLDFLKKFPEYKGRDFFITGESYAGIYLPTLAEHLIADKVNFPNFKGMAIGNGLLDHATIDYRTLIPLYYYHGLIRHELYVRIRSMCCGGNMETCDVYTKRHDLNDPTCTALIQEAMSAANNLNPYNLYQTCYTDGVEVERKEDFIANSNRRRMGMAPIKKKATADNTTVTPLCAQTSNIHIYMNRADVRKALHIPTSVHKWTNCNKEVDLAYTKKYTNMAKQIMAVSSADIKILIYNGDVDTICSNVMNMQFVASLNKTILGIERVNQPWTYNGENPNVAGFMTQYSDLDYLTVRGSGHYVPRDKPRESLQMIYNFVKGNHYSDPIPF